MPVKNSIFFDRNIALHPLIRKSRFTLNTRLERKKQVEQEIKNLSRSTFIFGVYVVNSPFKGLYLF